MHIEVKEFDPGVNNEYLADKYPGVGLYLNKRLNQVFAVSRIPSVSVPTVMGTHLVDLIKQEPEAGAISEGFILRALAIAQNPNLAKELV